MSETSTKPSGTTSGGSRPPLVGSRRELLIGGGFLAAAATAFALTPRDPLNMLGKNKIDALVPNRFAGWNFVAASGLVLPPEDQLEKQLYSQLLTRTYINARGVQMMLLIAYNGAQDGVVQIHRPEVCYPAGGFKLTTIEEHTLPLASGLDVPSRFIIAETGLRREQIVYWTRLGQAFPRRWSEQRWAVFTQNLQGKIPDGLLVRISSVSPDVSVAELDGFARDLYASVGTTMRHVLVGLR
ncbi:exosortase-associated protein EpsI, V-type [Sphingomonas sp. GB1N7]|uniref:exosortase-associated protein EpsI, V-type n=1 Tax=Parasphingomonas caseinilytica TaxID=3096158 RepID=UPI002FC72D63